MIAPFKLPGYGRCFTRGRWDIKYAQQPKAATSKAAESFAALRLLDFSDRTIARWIS